MPLPCPHGQRHGAHPAGKRRCLAHAQQDYALECDFSFFDFCCAGSLSTMTDSSIGAYADSRQALLLSWQVGSDTFCRMQHLRRLGGTCLSCKKRCL